MSNTHHQTRTLFWVALAVIFIPSSFTLEGQTKSTQSDEAGDATQTLRERLDAERQARIDEMWETGEFETDAGGMIPRAALIRGRRVIHPLPPEPIRRPVFNQWLDRLDITDAVDVGTVETIWQQYVERINLILLEHYAPVYDVSAVVAESPTPKNHAAAAAHEEMVAMSKTARREATRAEDQLLRMLSAIDQGRFAPEIEAWQRYRRWERTSIFQIELSGADIHLSQLLEEIGIEWPNPPLQHAYELEIAAAAERRLSQALSNSSRMMAMMAAGFYNDQDDRHEPGSDVAREAFATYQRSARPLRRQQLRAQRSMYTVNWRYLTLLSVLLETADAERLHDVFTYQAFRDHFPNPYDLRPWFDEVVDDDRITDKLRRQVAELRGTLMTVQHGVNESIIRDIHRLESDFLVDRTYNPQTRERQKRELEDTIQRRRIDNAVVFAMRLVDLLENHDRFDWVREDLEELLGTSLVRP